MSLQDHTQSSMEATNQSIIDWIKGLVTDATHPPKISIPRVPQTVKDKHEYEKYFVPKVVSIGPYYFGNPKLQLVEKLKPVFTLEIFLNNEAALTSLYKTLGEPEMVKDLRRFYEHNDFSDEVFTKMMLLDSCFILYFITLIYSGWAEVYSELKSNEIFFVRRDLFLLENQIPFKVLKEVMKSAEIHVLKDTKKNLLEYIEPFIRFSSFVIRSNCRGDEDGKEEPYHLLGALHGKHCRIVEPSKCSLDPSKFNGFNFRKVSELADVGIRFKPFKDRTLSMTRIKYDKCWWGFSANVKLPKIAVSDYTKPMLLNLMAYEACWCSIGDSWVTSFVCLLDSLIDDVEDVKVLRKAWVLENFLSSDNEVADLFNEIAADLVPSSSAYSEAKYKMQMHYESRTNRSFSQLKNEYFKSPWAIIALLGALIALFLTGVQTYYTIWSPESTCDDLFMFLKMNHHL